MNCSRCQGLLCFSELRDEGGLLVTEGAPVFRCILCGELIDSVILMNRTRTAAERKLRRQKKFYFREGIRLNAITRLLVEQEKRDHDLKRRYTPH